MARDLFLQEICSLHIRGRECEGEGELFKGAADQVSLLAAGESHVPADSHSLLAGEAHKAADHVDAFFAVTVGQPVADRIVGDFFPLSGLVVFGVTVGDAVEVDLANVVEERDDGDGLLAWRQVVDLADAFPLDVVFKTVVNVEGVVKQSPLVGAVEARACGRGEEVAVHQEVKQLVRSVAADIIVVDLNKSFSVGHGLRSPFSYSP